MSLKLMKILPFSDIIYNRKLTEVSRWKYPTKIISYMDTLSALDTDGVEPLTNLSDTVNVLREDETGETLGVEEALSNAAETAGGCFCVPKTVERGAL